MAPFARMGRSSTWEIQFVRRLLAALAAIALFSTSASASPGEVSRAMPNAEKVGEAAYSILSVRLFNAELFADGGRFSWERPFALSLTYRPLGAGQHVDQPLDPRDEFTRRRQCSTTRAAAHAIGALLLFVSRGDRFTGVSTGQETATFYLNGAQRCEVRWPNFRRHFFGIWLAGRDGAAARISAQLRGES